MKKRLLVLTKLRDNACTWYRVHGPMSLFDKMNRDTIEVIPFKGDITLDNILYYDAVYFYRPSTPDEFKVITVAKGIGLKVWIDYDDDLFNIDPFNPSHDTFKNPEIQKAISECCAKADIISVSTNYLKSIYSVLNKNVVVIPNAFDFRTAQRKEKPNNHNFIYWRGSNTHNYDVDCYKEAISQVASEHKDYRLFFIGKIDRLLMSKMSKHLENQFIVLDGIPLQRYFDFLNESNFKINIVPLAKTKFNLSKSNIAYQEAAYAGAACLCPDWEEWQRPGATNYNDQETFYNGLKKLINDEEYRKKCSSDAWDYVSTKESLPVINILREAILKQLF